MKVLLSICLCSAVLGAFNAAAQTFVGTVSSDGKVRDAEGNLVGTVNRETGESQPIRSQESAEREAEQKLNENWKKTRKEALTQVYGNGNQLTDLFSSGSSSEVTGAPKRSDAKVVLHNGIHQWGMNQVVAESTADFNATMKDGIPGVSVNEGSKGGTIRIDPKNGKATITGAEQITNEEYIDNYMDECNKVDSDGLNGWDKTELNARNTMACREGVRQLCNTLSECGDEFAITRDRDKEKKLKKEAKVKADTETKNKGQEKKKDNDKKNKDKDKKKDKEKKKTAEPQKEKETPEDPATDQKTASIPTTTTTHHCTKFEFVRDQRAGDVMWHKIYRCTECGKEKMVDVKNGEAIDDVIAENKKVEAIDKQREEVLEATQKAVDNITTTDPPKKSSPKVINWKDYLTDY